MHRQPSSRLYFRVFWEARHDSDWRSTSQTSSGSGVWWFFLTVVSQRVLACYTPSPSKTTGLLGWAVFELDPRCLLCEGTLGFGNIQSSRSPHHYCRFLMDCASSFPWSAQIPGNTVVTGGPHISFYKEWIMTFTVLDLLEPSCLDTGCRFFFTSSRFAESDHLCLLFFHLLSHSGKHLEELFAIGLGLKFGGLHSPWRCRVWMRIFSVRDVKSDRLGRRFIGSGASIFPFSFRAVGTAVVI